MVLTNNLVFGKKVNRQYDPRYAVEGAKIGNVLNIRNPVRYTVSKQAALAVQDVTETSVPVTLDQQAQVAMNFTSVDLLLSIDEFSDRIVKPAVAAIANQIDLDGLALYKKVANFVGTVGTTPNALLTYLLAGVALDNNSAPQDQLRTLCLNPLMQATIVDALKGLFQSQTQIKAQYEKGEMGTAAGFTWMMDQNINNHTVGGLGGTPVIDGAAQTGSTIKTKGWTNTTATVKKGDVLTFVGTNGVNIQSRQDTNALQQFVVTADTTSDGAGKMSIPVYPPMTPSGAAQTVTASPADNALISVFGVAQAGQGALAGTVSPQALAFHRDAFALVSADLPMPKGVDMAARVSDSASGLSIRLIRDYDINTDKFPCRLDVLYGWAALRPELACRIAA